ncbi:MAG: thioredoxin family protein [Bacteroidales bacterium]|nr:thioredoxin family protein [Bacteroidales bacterium]
MKRHLSIALLLLAAPLLLLAQIQDPAHWSFKANNISETKSELLFTVKLDAGWHIYSQHTDPDGPIALEFVFEPSSDYKRVGEVREPKAHEEFDKLFGCTVRSFEGVVVFRQTVERKSSESYTVKGTLSYQLCNEGSCIPPDDVEFAIRVPEAPQPEAADSVKAQYDTAAQAIVDTTTHDTTAATAIAKADNTGTEADGDKAEQSLLVLFLIALGTGVITMFTPCVFPMIPMTVNYFMHNTSNPAKNRRQAWFFGASIVFIFAVLGAVLTLLFGPEVMYAIGTNWIVNLVFFVIFMVFALSFFGLFEIRMPEKWINKSDAQADKGGLMAPFFIALTTVLVSFSCTGPILGAALIGLVSAGASRWVGLVSLLGFGIGFAAPFTLLAMFPSVLSKFKSGSWLNTVKVVFAFLELVFGLKFLQMADLAQGWGLLPRDIYLAIWIVLFALLGIYLLGKLRFKGDEPVEHIGVLRLFLAIASLSLAVYMVPGLWGAPLKGLSGFLPPMESQDFNIEKIVLENRSGVTDQQGSPSVSALPADRKYADQLHMPVGFEGFFDLEEAKAYSRKAGKPVFIDFTGMTCANCREMEHYVWSDSEAKRLLQNEFVMCALYADVNTIDLPESEWVQDEKGRTLKTLGRRNLNYQKTAYNMNAQPYYVIVDADGKVLTAENYKYDRDVAKFIAYLNEGLATYRNRMQ